MHTAASIESALADFIGREIAYDRAASSIRNDEPLLNGLIDSFDVLRLVVFVEERFGVTVEDVELVPENFATVHSLAEFIGRKQSSA